jgi:hypothetical protein
VLIYRENDLYISLRYLTHPTKNVRAIYYRVLRLEGSGFIYTLLLTCSTYVSDNIAINREIMRGSIITTPLPYLFRAWNEFPPSSIPVLVARTKGNRSSYVNRRRRVIVFERGAIEISD